MGSNWDIAAFFALAWRQRVAVMAGIAGALLLGLIYMHIASPAYTVSIQLVPAPASLGNENAAGGLSALAGGILGGSASPTSFKIYTAGLQSHAAAELVAHDQALMRRTFSDQWSEVDHAWRPRYGLLHPITGPIKWALGIPSVGWHPPDANDVFEFVRDNVTVQDSRDSPVLTVAMKARNPAFAADFLKALSADADLITRQRALNRADEYIAYIGRELPHITVEEYRASLINHLNDQEKTRMMASAMNVGYSADVFSGPMTSQRPTSPNFFNTMIISILAGCVLGLLLGFYHDARGQIFLWPWLTLSWQRHRSDRFASGLGR